jgi:UDP-glucose 4-epimerase
MDRAALEGIEEFEWRRILTLPPMVGTSRCDVPARVPAGGTCKPKVHALEHSYRRLTLRSATGTARRARPYLCGADPGCALRMAAPALELGTSGRLPYFPGMNVFVTGGAGYIGSVCVEELLNAGHQVTVYDNLTEGHRSAVDSRAKFILAETGTPGNLAQVVTSTSPEAILHFAANALVGESMANPGKYFQNNVCNGLQLLEAAVRAKVKKFVFSSTCATYGPPERLPITEDLPQRPINPYGESKLMFERMLHWYREIHRLEFVAFRYFNAAGASERFGEHHRIETHLIPNVLKVPLGQLPRCEIFGTDYPTPDGTCIRDYIHIIDLAQAHILAIAPGKSGFFNLGNGDGYSVRQVIQTCEQVTGKKIAAIEKPRRAGDPPKLVAGSEKAIRELGWKPKYPRLIDIVSTAWNWHKKNPNGYPD